MSYWLAIDLNRKGTSNAMSIDPAQQCRFVVLTKNSARWLDVILNAYEALGISPFVLLDASSSDGDACEEPRWLSTLDWRQPRIGVKIALNDGGASNGRWGGQRAQGH